MLSPLEWAICEQQVWLNATREEVAQDGRIFYGGFAKAVEQEFADYADEQRKNLAMADFDRDRLLHYCKMLDDADQGRRLGAARGLASFIKQHGLSWDDIIVKPEKVAGVTIGPSRTQWPHVDFVKELLAGGLPLSNFEREFCTSMSNWTRAPTEKQAAVLDRMRNKFPNVSAGMALASRSNVNSGYGSQMSSAGRLGSHGP